MPPVTLLGPQRHVPIVAETLETLGLTGWVATITAGWEEREVEDDELRAHLSGRSFNLQLWERCEKIFASDPGLHEGMRKRYERLARLHDLYRIELSHALAACAELERRDDAADLLDPECDAALDIVRRIDAHHLDRVAEVHAAFEAKVRPLERPLVERHRREISRQLEDAEVLAIAGGHVAVLLNRLRLFGVLDLAERLPIVAWSAGAMALCEQIVLFHDTPPQGAGNPEVLDRGLAACRGIIALPHAKARLDLEDPVRVSLFARRFAPLRAVPMNDRASLVADGKTVAFAPDTRVLGIDGSLEVAS